MVSRRWVLGILAGACASGRADTAHENSRNWAKNAPLRMVFRGSTAGECRQWQGRFRAKLAELMGDYQPPWQWTTEVESATDLEDHRRESLLLKADGYPDLPVYRLTPNGAGEGQRAGILALHGHGAFGHDPVAGVATTPERKAAIKGANYDYGLQLVRRGYVVVAPCFAPFGRRLGDKAKYGGDDPCAVEFVRMQLLGKTLMVENLRDALWGLELLATTDGVNAEKLGCVGLSYGGRMTMLTTAMAQRIKVAVVSGALNVMQERISLRYSCGAQVIPGLLEYGDVPEIAGLIAPRPAVWEVGNKDPLMVKEWVGPALERIERVYRALGAADQLQLDRFNGHHRWSGDVAFGVLDRVLTS